jgi:hypothetical protein
MVEGNRRTGWMTVMRGFLFWLAELDEAGAEEDRLGYP